MVKPDSWLQTPLEYTVVRSRRRTMALVLHPDNQLEVRCGFRVPEKNVRHFILEKENWIRRKMQENSQLIPVTLPESGQQAALRQETKLKVEAILKQFPDLVPARVTIRKQKRRWGSCSKIGSLSINLCAGLLPDTLLEYIVVHELCHLVHFDHSSRFHQLLQMYLPDARYRRKSLQRYLIT